MINVLVVIRDITFMIRNVNNSVLYERLYQRIKQFVWIVVKIVYSARILIIACNKSIKYHVHLKISFLFNRCFARDVMLIVQNALARAHALFVKISIFWRMECA